MFVSFRKNLYCNGSLDMRVWIIIFQDKVIESKFKNAFYRGVNFHHRQFSGFSCKLQFHLSNVIEINMGISKSMHKFKWFQSCNMSCHHQQQGVGCNVERNTQKNISTSLVKLTGKFSVIDVKLKKHMTWRQIHIVKIGDIPCTDNMSP